MSYELAIMALEGLRHTPVSIRQAGGEVVIEGSSDAFKHLARLCLLLGGGRMEEGFELQPGMHVTSASPGLRLRLAPDA